MSSIKEFYIQGWMPFGARNNETVLEFLGRISLPAFGLRVQLGPDCKLVPNQFRANAQIRMYYFTITGKEDISFQSYAFLLKELEKIGIVERESCIECQ